MDIDLHCLIDIASILILSLYTCFYDEIHQVYSVFGMRILDVACIKE